MSDSEVVSTLIDLAAYIVPAVVGAALWLLGWRRKPRGGSSFLMGLGVVLLVVLGIASIQPISNALDRANASSTSRSQAASPSTTLSHATTTTGACTAYTCRSDQGLIVNPDWVPPPPLPNPITSAQEVWCQASPENQVYVMLAADILELHEFDRGALTRALEGALTDADRDTIVEQAGDWPIGRMWEQEGEIFIDPSQPSAWALACAAAHESVFGS